MDVTDESDLRQYLSQTPEEIRADNERFDRYLEERLEQEAAELMANVSNLDE